MRHPRRPPRSVVASTASSFRAVLAQPFGDRVFVPPGPGPALPLEKQLTDLMMLFADRLFRVDRHEIEDERQRFVLADDAGNEVLVALDRILDVRDVLTRLVKVRH